jgi:hypothetical protein
MDAFELDHPGQCIYHLAEDTDYPTMSEERAAKVDAYICLCQSHAEYVRRTYPYLKDKIVIGANGIRLDLIEKIEKEGPIIRNPRKMIFASSPDRGLLPLLKIFRRAREWVSGADGNGPLELHVFYGFQNLLTGMEDAPKGHPNLVLYNKCMAEMKQPGVFWHDRTPQPELLRHWLSAGIFCHPSVFTETNFINIQDAMACGAIPITIPIWAAGEFVRHGIFVWGDPYSDPLTIARFVGEVYRLASNVGLQEQIRSEMMPYARKRFDWEKSVDKFEGWIRAFGVALYRQVAGWHPKISLIHSTARLPDGWQEACDTWLERADSPQYVEYTLCTDEPLDRVFDIASPADAQKKRYGSFRYAVNHDRKCAVDGWNAAAAVATGKLLITVSDDWFPPEHWDTELLKCIPDLDGEYVLDVDNQDGSTELMPFSLLTRKYYDRFGFVFYPEYLGMMADWDYTKVARQLGVVINAKHLKFEHKNPEAGTAEWDEVYQHQRRKEAQRIGEAVFARRAECGFSW